MWLSREFYIRLCKANVKPMSEEVKKILNIGDNISLIYEELETIFKWEQSTHEREIVWMRIYSFLLEEDTIIVDYESISNVQSKRKSRRTDQNQSRLPLTKLLTVRENVPIREPLIVPTNIIVTPDSIVSESAPKPCLIKTSNRHENDDIVMSEINLLVE